MVESLTIVSVYLVVVTFFQTQSFVDFDRRVRDSLTRRRETEAKFLEELEKSPKEVRQSNIDVKSIEFKTAEYVLEMRLALWRGRLAAFAVAQGFLLVIGCIIWILQATLLGGPNDLLFLIISFELPAFAISTMLPHIADYWFFSRSFEISREFGEGIAAHFGWPVDRVAEWASETIRAGRR